jgi:hypothetical protein
MTNRLPEEFAALEPFAEKWGLETQDERQAKRLGSSSAEIKEFYDAITPFIPRIMAIVDGYPLGELPPSLRCLFAMALSLAEIAPHVELYRGNVGVPHAFAEMRFVAKHGRMATWKAELPS